MLLHERTKMPIPFIIYWKSIHFCVYIICRALLLLKFCRSIECSHHRRLADILKNINTTIDKMILSRLLFFFSFFFYLEPVSFVISLPKILLVFKCLIGPCSHIDSLYCMNIIKMYGVTLKVLDRS